MTSIVNDNRNAAFVTRAPARDGQLRSAARHVGAWCEDDPVCDQPPGRMSDFPEIHDKFMSEASNSRYIR
jgi:hypothetical protein